MIRRDYDCIVLFTIVGLIILTLGWRKPNHIFRWAVIVWASLLFLSSLAIFISDPGMVITGETLSLELPFAWTLLPFDTLYFVITLIWFIRVRQDMKQRPDQQFPKWTTLNTLFLILAIMLIPVEYVLFNAGELHGSTDQAAVILTFIQYVVINLCLVPWKQTRAANG